VRPSLRVTVGQGLPLLCAALAVPALLAGCGGNDTSSSSSPTEAACRLVQDTGAEAKVVGDAVAKSTYDPAPLVARMQQLSDQADRLSKQFPSDSDASSALTDLSDALTNVIEDVRGRLFRGAALSDSQRDLDDLKSEVTVVKGDVHC
jgi:cytochrome c556